MNIVPTLLFIAVSTVHAYYESEDYATSRLNKKYECKGHECRDYIRCTRRFTPGTCTEPVTSVWTFVFQIQNCTERLGCPLNSRRTNRYISYATCMRRCQALMDVYTNILAHDNKNITHYLRDHSWLSGNSRRDAKINIVEKDEDYAVPDEAEESKMQNPDPDPNEDQGVRYMPIADIDYISGDNIGDIELSNN